MIECMDAALVCCYFKHLTHLVSLPDAQHPDSLFYCLTLLMLLEICFAISSRFTWKSRHYNLWRSLCYVLRPASYQVDWIWLFNTAVNCGFGCVSNLCVRKCVWPVYWCGPFQERHVRRWLIYETSTACFAPFHHQLLYIFQVRINKPVFHLCMWGKKQTKPCTSPPPRSGSYFFYSWQRLLTNKNYDPLRQNGTLITILGLLKLKRGPIGLNQRLKKKGGMCVIVQQL